MLSTTGLWGAEFFQLRLLLITFSDSQVSRDRLGMYACTVIFLLCLLTSEGLNKKFCSTHVKSMLCNSDLRGKHYKKKNRSFTVK